MADDATLEAAITAALESVDDMRAVLGVCAACADWLPADGAAVTVMTSDVQRQTIYASDKVIAGFEQAQYALGEGPSLQAFTDGRPVLVPFMSDSSIAARWPVLVSEVAALPVGAVFCFPMSFGVIDVGVVAFYRRLAGRLSAAEVSMALRTLELTTLALLEIRGGDASEFLLGRWLAVDGLQRRQVHQATGMLMGQFGVPAEAAFARLRAHAFGTGRDIEQVAADIVERRIRLDVEEI